MAMGTVYRDFRHSDHEHEARENGFNAGYDQANYVDAYGPTPETEMPERFAEVAQIWTDAYEEGKDDFETVQSAEEMYGHDWHDWTEAASR
ncbi:hypothetical protein E1161_13435 [Saccharopolyspora aridisoli]|uniref:Uncharacterized protein n=1 Tax=Saccharopolyspora aridisoli TaxID=2530385 RepID=A0A4R4UZU9_9PSEU|nr:hypothetical protein [Saccharopolyspora aridisoli]TDC92369.1 hypothetical protein E1161_13435 [Saccharopolyspora aridisoli]